MRIVITDVSPTVFEVERFPDAASELPDLHARIEARGDRWDMSLFDERQPRNGSERTSADCLLIVPILAAGFSAHPAWGAVYELVREYRLP